MGQLALRPATDDLTAFVHFGEIAQTTAQLLALGVRQVKAPRRVAAGRPEPVTQLIVQQARDYLQGAREGLALGVRAEQVRSQDEARWLVRRVLLEWDTLSRELGLEETGSAAHAPGSDAERSSSVATRPYEPLERPRTQVLAFAMAAVALGALPRTPSDEVTFPAAHVQPATYADIPAPSTPGEVMDRLEEMELLLWRVLGEDMQDLVSSRYGPLRRTYGFFEVSARLAQRAAGDFGMRPSTNLRLFGAAGTSPGA